MGYLILCISEVIASIKVYFTKQISTKTVSLRDIVLSNLIRIVTTVAVGALVVLVMTGHFPQKLHDPRNYVLTGISGLMIFLSYVTNFYAFRQCSFMMTNMFGNLSVFIPIVLMAVFNNETVSFIQIIGLVVMIASFWCFSRSSERTTGKVTVFGVLMALTGALCGGIQSYCMKLFAIFDPSENSSMFSFCTFSAAAVLFIGSYGILRLRGREEGGRLSFSSFSDPRMLLRILFIGFGASTTNFMTAWAASMLPSVVVFPFQKGLTIISTFIFSVFFVRERPNRYSILGIVLTVIALFIINLLPKLLQLS